MDILTWILRGLDDLSVFGGETCQEELEEIRIQIVKSLEEELERIPQQRKEMEESFAKIDALDSEFQKKLVEVENDGKIALEMNKHRTRIDGAEKNIEALEECNIHGETLERIKLERLEWHKEFEKFLLKRQLTQDRKTLLEDIRRVKLISGIPFKAESIEEN